MNKPFGPALTAAINLLSRNFQRDIGQIFNAEAKSLNLDPGWAADVEHQQWTWPEEPKGKKSK
jgi:hypothetical protein